MRPVFGSIAMTAPCSPPRASKAAFCTAALRLSSTFAPRGGCPVKMRSMRAMNCSPPLPESAPFSACSMPVRDPSTGLKNPVTGAHMAGS